MKKNKFSNKKWTEGFKKQLIDMINEGATIKQIARKLGRSVDAIYNKMSEMKLKLKTTIKNEDK